MTRKNHIVNRKKGYVEVFHATCSQWTKHPIIVELEKTFRFSFVRRVYSTDLNNLKIYQKTKNEK